MTKQSWNTKNTIQIIILIICIIFSGLMATAEIKTERWNDYLTNVRFESGDGEIKVSWDLPEFNRASAIKVTISTGTTVQTISLPSRERSFTIDNGAHGQLYYIRVWEVYKNGTEGEKHSKKLLFLNYDQLPDFPTIRIETESGEDLPWTVAEKPDENLWGASVENNEYIPAGMSFTWSGHETLSSRTEVRVRGNTSSFGGGKQSYKLKLKQSLDMLHLGRKEAGKEWLLLNVGTNLNNYVGEFLSKYCDMDWVEHGMFVNVMLNGDWKGIYYLSQPVSRDTSDREVDKDGYIFENDAYWWKKDTVYFKTENQLYQFGYTFKYPDITDQNDQRVTDLKNYMDVITQKITSEDSDIDEYIDFDTFSSWVMVRDIMHSGDGGGSNIYYYLKDFDTDNYKDNKLKMGPVWDFDAGMKGSEVCFPDNTSWSTQHDSPDIFFAYLFQMPKFRNVYLKQWEKISPTLQTDLNQCLDSINAETGPAIDASRALDSARWENDMTSVSDEIAYDKEFISQRISVINNGVKDW
jgi:hypothetical protein